MKACRWLAASIEALSPAVKSRGWQCWHIPLATCLCCDWRLEWARRVGGTLSDCQPLHRVISKRVCRPLLRLCRRNLPYGGVGTAAPKGLPQCRVYTLACGPAERCVEARPLRNFCAMEGCWQRLERAAMKAIEFRAAERSCPFS